VFAWPGARLVLGSIWAADRKFKLGRSVGRRSGGRSISPTPDQLSPTLNLLDDPGPIQRTSREAEMLCSYCAGVAQHYRLKQLTGYLASALLHLELPDDDRAGGPFPPAVFILAAADTRSCKRSENSSVNKAFRVVRVCKKLT
jgi:hypothetical protein